jgi:hypothetical protein
MAKKRRKRRPADEYQLPPRVEQARQAKARATKFRPSPELPQWRVVWTGLGMFALCTGMALSFWIPARSTVQHLRSQGVTVAAIVISTDEKPKYVKVRLVQGPKSGTEVKLVDYAGMYPDTHTGASMLVTYDPHDVSQSLAHDWVVDPPANLPAYGTSALAVVFLGLTVAVLRRRRWVLRTFGPKAPLHPSVGGGKPSSGGVHLTKPFTQSPTPPLVLRFLRRVRLLPVGQPSAPPYGEENRPRQEERGHEQ